MPPQNPEKWSVVCYSPRVVSQDGIPLDHTGQPTSRTVDTSHWPQPESLIGDSLLSLAYNSLTALLNEINQQKITSMEVVAITVEDLAEFKKTLTQVRGLSEPDIRRMPTESPDPTWSLLGYEVANSWLNWAPWTSELSGPLAMEENRPLLTSYESALQAARQLDLANSDPAGGKRFIYALYSVGNF